MTKVQNLRTNAEFELLAKTAEGDYKLKDLSTGKEKIITSTIFEKWYKVTEGEIAEQPSEEIKAEEVTEEVKKEEVKEEEKVKEEVKPKRKVGRPKKDKPPKAPKSKEPHVLKDVLEKILKANHCEIFVTQVRGFHTVKVDSHMCMAYTFSTKGIVLWMRSKAIEVLNLKTTYMKHMFDARMHLRENNEESVDIIRKVVAASVEYQRNVNVLKIEKAKARQEYLAKKEAERAEKKEKNMAAKFGIKQKKKAKKEDETENTTETVAEETQQTQEE